MFIYELHCTCAVCTCMYTKQSITVEVYIHMYLAFHVHTVEVIHFEHVCMVLFLHITYTTYSMYNNTFLLNGMCK